MIFGLRFDLRNPPIGGTSIADRYGAALDMAEWADRLGCVDISVSEHHGSPDGYLPSPVTMLAAMAARTTNVHFTIAALIAAFYEPLRLAEDLIVLDNLSRGRVDLIVAGGYVPSEFGLFDVPMAGRGRIVTETVRTLKGAFSGEPFEYRGRTVRLTPAPCRPGGPRVSLGGSSEAAARRAARIADGFVPAVPEVWEFYRDEVRALGHPDPGPSPVGDVEVVALAEDPEAGWRAMSPFFLHETNAYGAWHDESGAPSPYRRVADTDALRDTGRYRVVTPAQLVDEVKGAPFPFLMLHPLCGGMPVDLAWASLRLFEERVLPAFA